MDLQTIFFLAKPWTLVMVFVTFLAIVGYALWPSNQKQFDEAARMPLNED